jgi:hypothetical protein
MSVTVKAIDKLPRQLLLDQMKPPVAVPAVPHAKV